MKDRFLLTWQLIKENWKILIIFETIYRVIGLAIIFPLANQLLFLSITLEGKKYITNADFLDYISSPFTVLIYLIIILVFGMYVVFEIVTLSFLFHETYYENQIDLEALLLTSIIRTKEVLQKYHLSVILSSLIFFGLIEGLHIAGVATTIKFPDLILSQINNIFVVQLLIGFLIFTLILLFFATIFYEIQCTIENRSFKETFIHSKKIFKNNYLKILSDFLLLNGLLNFVLYLAYLIITGVVALIVLITINQAALFGIMLSGVYSVYIVIGFIATIILMPVNFAWINVWYYEHKKTMDIDLEKTFNLYSKRPTILRKKWFKRGIIALLIAVLGFNIYLIQDRIVNNQANIQLFDNPSVIAHRGSSFDAPENTLAAIEKAINDGADAVEVDIRFTNDNVPILMHDEKLTRTTNDPYNRKVQNLSLAEIKELDAGSWFDPAYAGETVPTLEEALLLAKDGNIDLYIEIKASTENIGDILIDLFESTNMSYNVKLLSFNGLLLENIKRENRRIETVMLLNSFLGNLDVLIDNEYIDTYGLRYNLIMNNKDYVEALKESGKNIYVYTVNDPVRITEMNNLGVDGIITDVPIITREIIYQDTTTEMFDQILELLFKRQ